MCEWIAKTPAVVSEKSRSFAPSPSSPILVTEGEDSDHCHDVPVITIPFCLSKGSPMDSGGSSHAAPGHRPPLAVIPQAKRRSIHLSPTQRGQVPGCKGSESVKSRSEATGCCDRDDGDRDKRPTTATLSQENPNRSDDELSTLKSPHPRRKPKSRHLEASTIHAEACKRRRADPGQVGGFSKRQLALDHKQGPRREQVARPVSEDGSEDELGF